MGNREEIRRAKKSHNVLLVGRVHRTTVAGHTIAVSLELIEDEQQVTIEHGDEFVTLLAMVDPWEDQES